jgi:thioredoxin reductase
MQEQLYDAAIVGGGAAGLSAALVLGRSCRRVILFDDGRPRNAVATEMHGFITRDGTPPAEVLRIAREELRRYPGVECVSAHVSEAKRDGDLFALRTREGAQVRARRVLLATGLYDALPEIDGLRERWGKSVFVCPYCDGWEVRDRRLAVIGIGDAAVGLAQELYQWSNDLLICTQGEGVRAQQQRWIDAAGATVRNESITALTGEAIVFEGGSRERCDAAFLCAPLRQRYPLVDMLGCLVRENGEIAVDDRGRTSASGVYAAGDAVTTIHQVVLAAASGVRAAMAINQDQLEEDVLALSR